MRCSVPVLLLPALLGLGGCVDYSYTSEPNFTAECTIQDYVDPMMGPSQVPRWQGGALQRTVYATAQNLTGLQDKLEIQGAGTYLHPCVALNISNLSSHRRVFVRDAKVYPYQIQAQEKTYTVHFAFDHSDLDGNAKQILSDAVRQIQTEGYAHIRVVGHTDTAGSQKYNQRLSDRRAAAVQRAMEDMGLPRAIVSTRGAGERELLVPTPDGTPNAMNRRAEITFE